MSARGSRKIGEGRVVAVHHNDGLRKLCGCPRARWSQCPHSWHFNFTWKGTGYRFGLDRHLGHHIDSRAKAESEVDKLRLAIREGRHKQLATEAGRNAAGDQEPSVETSAEATNTLAATAPTVRRLADEWMARRGYQLVRPRDNAYRFRVIWSFIFPGVSTECAFGDKPAASVTAGDIEAFRHARLAKGLSPVTVNHDLKLLRKMFSWAVRERLLDMTPFKVGTESVVKLSPETPRDKRFASDDDEPRLRAAANPHLWAIIVFLLDTCCRLGEALKLKWRDIDFLRRQVTIRPENTKTRTGRVLPISSRLLAILESRRLGPDGVPLGQDAYVFGNDIGEPRRSVRTAWMNARAKAGLHDIQLRDLRHEAGSRFVEAGVSTVHVSKFLGHTNLATTSRYLSSTVKDLHGAMERLEAARSNPTNPAPRLEGEDVSTTGRGMDTEKTDPPKPRVS